MDCHFKILLLLAPGTQRRNLVVSQLISTDHDCFCLTVKAVGRFLTITVWWSTTRPQALWVPISGTWWAPLKWFKYLSVHGPVLASTLATLYIQNGPSACPWICNMLLLIPTFFHVVFEEDQAIRQARSRVCHRREVHHSVWVAV